MKSKKADMKNTSAQIPILSWVSPSDPSLSVIQSGQVWGRESNFLVVSLLSSLAFHHEFVMPMYLRLNFYAGNQFQWCLCLFGSLCFNYHNLSLSLNDNSIMSDSATPGTVAHQAPPSMGFSKQEYWSGWPFPSPGYLPNSEIEPGSPELQVDYHLSYQGSLS